MIRVAGRPYTQNDLFPGGSTEAIILQRLMEDSDVHAYRSMDELIFEVELRRQIILSARALHDSDADFEVFIQSRGNPRYWNVSTTGVFRLQRGVLPADAIRDIFMNSSQYGFECATAMVIIYYDAVLKLLGDRKFNQIFPDLYLYSWHFDSDLGIQARNSTFHIPGDVVYFNNPDFNWSTPQWRGENAIVLEDGMYYGHGIGMKSAREMINELNQRRNPGSTISAYVTTQVTFPNFKHLARIMMMRADAARKFQYVIIEHDECSIDFDRYIKYMHTTYQRPHPFPPRF
ncbi:protein-glutamine gamma-glutamyltransferase [Alteribacillus sp. HJP-4]|uniref:protein-glutamine gamma-glutamyltransferase n=1 Tax=Alteribacillus sp. HJP-4 TaxID=2775394 RepID=UPI0035CCDF21